MVLDLHAWTSLCSPGVNRGQHQQRNMRNETFETHHSSAAQKQKSSSLMCGVLLPSCCLEAINGRFPLIRRTFSILCSLIEQPQSRQQWKATLQCCLKGRAMRHQQKNIYHMPCWQFSDNSKIAFRTTSCLHCLLSGVPGAVAELRWTSMPVGSHTGRLPAAQMQACVPSMPWIRGKGNFMCWRPELDCMAHRKCLMCGHSQRKPVHIGVSPRGWRGRPSTTGCLMRCDPESNSLTSLASAYRKSPFLPFSCPPSSVHWCDVTPATPPRRDVFPSRAWILSFPSITPTLQPRRRFLKPRWHVCLSESSDFQRHHHFWLGLAFFSFGKVQVSFCCSPRVWLSAGRRRDMFGLTNMSFLAELTVSDK